ncbi:MAG: dephospho-CoA kinase [Sedimentisphaerales bacterium]|nr:dephospho-CoA kinase [Sedimentisphaerales bacterium]
MHEKPVIGILGGIGSGKSSVAGAFSRLGCAVVDADKMALEMLVDGDVVRQIVDIFGPDITVPAGEIDRKKLADRVFSNPELLKTLNGIIHPRVLKQTEALLIKYQADDAIPAIVLDVPLLMETGWHNRCDVLVFVESDLAVRQTRVHQKGRFDADQIKKRENFQISLDKKRENAQYIVKNNSDLSDLAEQVARIYSAVLKM